MATDPDAAPPLDLPELSSRPRHIAIIMDGNGRWARERGVSRQAGHRAGTENIRTVIERTAQHGIPYLTLYAFSTENWKRSKAEVSSLMRILGHYLDREVRSLHEHGARLVHIGRLEVLPERLQRGVLEAIELTRNNTRITVCLAFNYGGRAEIADAVRRIVAAGIPADQITEDVITAYLYTSGIPDPDLIIRTAGEMRLSNFMLWQGAYAELFSTPTYWPDFGSEQLDAALWEYASRERRYGGRPDSDKRRSRRQSSKSRSSE